MEQIQNISIRMVGREDLPILREIAKKMGSSKRKNYFEQALEYQEVGTRLVLIASIDGQDAGYCMLAWQPKYGFFKKMDMPEIQDLNVIPEFRRCGIATFMIDYCEDLARQKGKTYIGIGVGMDFSYGAAQQLYVRRGYVPDGNGLTYDRKTIAHGEFRPVDDEMSLMLIKDLQT